MFLQKIEKLKEKVSYDITLVITYLLNISHLTVFIGSLCGALFSVLWFSPARHNCCFFGGKRPGLRCRLSPTTRQAYSRN